MQDTYRGVLASMKERSLVGLDRFDEMWELDSVVETVPSPASRKIAVIVDLDEWRLTRARGAR